MSEVYYGLALQMLTYLHIVVTYSKSLIEKKRFQQWVCIFMCIIPFSQSKRMLSLDKIEEEIYKSFKMNGLVLDHSNVIQLMDTSLDIENSGKSDIIPAGFKKDGSLLAATQGAEQEEFFASESSCAPYLSGGWRSNGRWYDVDVTPYKLKEKNAVYLLFLWICMPIRPSALEEGEQFRNLAQKKQNDVLELLKERGERWVKTRNSCSARGGVDLDGRSMEGNMG